MVRVSINPLTGLRSCRHQSLNEESRIAKAVQQRLYYVVMAPTCFHALNLPTSDLDERSRTLVTIHGCHVIIFYSTQIS
jgi:hypothetical protein